MRHGGKSRPAQKTNGPDKVHLQLEAIVLERGKELEKLPAEFSSVLNGGVTLTFLLFSVEACWHAPSTRTCLFSTPGIFVRDPDSAPPLYDPVVRCFAYHVLDLARRGANTDGTDWTEYLASPSKIGCGRKVKYALPIDLSVKAKGRKDQGL